MTIDSLRPVCVLGAGSWGTALAMLIARNGFDTILWGHTPKKVAEIQKNRRNERYLPGIALPDNLQVTSDLNEAVEPCETILIVVPSSAFRTTLTAIKPLCRESVRIAWATKGFDPENGALLHTLVEQIFSKDTPMAVVSGPTFAREVAAELPTAITIASNFAPFASDLAGLMRNSRFRPYTGTDMVGAQVGGAVKNVLAIAAGVTDGLGFGANTRAALVTRGLAEVMRLGLALGAEKETFMGLAGLGDLVLTCTDNQSRNRRLGLGIGRGQSVAETLSQIGQEVEGISAAKLVAGLARRHAIEMPICEQTFAVLYEGLEPTKAVENLLEREQKPEMERSL